VWSGKAPAPVRVVQCGHGFFGGREEVVNGVVPKLADKMGAVGVAVDWWGMSLADSVVLLSDLVQTPSEGLRFVERLHQGMVNQAALTWASRGGLWQLPALRRDGQALTDGQQVYFYGLSQGHILGGVQVAFNPWLDRAALGVGGAGFGLMMSRAAPFNTFAAMLEAAGGSPAAAARIMLTMIGPLERVDPISYAAHVRADTWPGSPPERRILMQVGIADTQVPNLASHVHARALGLPLLSPSPRPVWGLASAPAPAASAVVEFDFKTPALDATGPGGDNANPVHDAQRYLAASIDQIDRFFRPFGVIDQTCSGPCDPE